MPPIRAAPTGRGATAAGRAAGPQLRRLVAAVERGDSCEEVVEGLVGVRVGELVAAGRRADDRIDQIGILVDRQPRGGQNQLRVGRGAVAVDLEDPVGDAAAGEGDRLRVPEAGRGVDPAGGEGGDGIEADRDPATWAGSPPSARSSESTTASSEGRPVTPTVRPSRSRGRRTGPLRGR